MLQAREKPPPLHFTKLPPANGRIGTESIGIVVVRKIIKAAGYKWRKAKVVLTSNDQNYKEKLALIHSILSNLQPDEAFFSARTDFAFGVRRLIEIGIAVEAKRNGNKGVANDQLAAAAKRAMRSSE